MRKELEQGEQGDLAVHFQEKWQVHQWGKICETFDTRRSRRKLVQESEEVKHERQFGQQNRDRGLGKIEKQ